MKQFLIAVLVFFLFSCQNLKNDSNLPLPIKHDSPNSTIQPNSPPIIPTSATANYELSYMLKKTRIFQNQDSPASEAPVIADLLGFLVKEFGSSPCIINNIKIKFETNPVEHAVTKRKNKHKTVILSILNLYDTQQHFIVHELFHAYYQNNYMLVNRPMRELEKWATYAQYRYKYQDFDNVQIKKKLSEQFSITEQDIKYYQKFTGPWQALSSQSRTKAYIVNVLPMFDNLHSKNYGKYRNLLRKFDTKVCN